jgi:CheY-like chemotaxis protein
VLGGRILQGRLLDLSTQGLRVALDEAGPLSGGGGLKVGDRFQAVCISALPFTPQIHGRGRVAHLSLSGPEPYVGLSLEGISEGDGKNIERILAPRYPTTFGETFPARKRKTELADRLGAPTPVMVKAKAPEIVGVLAAAPAPVAERPATTAVMRLRKVGRKILLVSDHPTSPALAEAFRQDGFKQVSEARTFPEAKTLASEARYDLLVLDIRVGRHWAGDMMKALHDNDLLLDTPVVLLADYRNDGSLAMAGALRAVCLHERGKGYGELVPVVYKLLLE